jgi:hypothetical protein
LRYIAKSQTGDATFPDLTVEDRVAYEIVPSRTNPGKMQAKCTS